jgi:hypothetical protein
MNQVYPNPTQGEKTKKKNVETIVEPEKRVEKTWQNQHQLIQQ